MSSGGGLAEKFQITIPYRESAPKPDNLWVSAESQRINSGNTQPGHGEKFNRLPVTDVEVQEGRSKFVQGCGGDTDVSGERNFAAPNFFKQGYSRLDMKSTDDTYDGEHVDLFYGEAVDEKGRVGFCERNNYLDRS